MSSVNQQKTFELYEKIRSKFMEKGASYWDAVEKLKVIDTMIFEQITDELLTKQNPQNIINIYSLLAKKPKAEELAKALNVTPEQLTAIHEQKLEQYLLSMGSQQVASKISLDKQN